jgi:nucleoside-diphosphate-sugar epimerase
MNNGGARASSIFLAGATGAVGRPLCRLLVSAGHAVTGATRSPEKAVLLRNLGVTPVVVDVFDREALRRAVAAAHPDVVIHQLTDLPPGLDPALMDAARARNARLRVEGTRHLVAAAVAAGATRFVAQSLAFAYAPGPRPRTEEMDLYTDAADPLGSTARAVESLEEQVLESGLESVLLRYGKFYGPGTGFEAAPPEGPVHVEAAARAALLAVARGEGVYNIAEDDGAVSSVKAQRELGWDAGFRLSN